MIARWIPLWLGLLLACGPDTIVAVSKGTGGATLAPSLSVPVRTAGGQLVDANGHVVRLTGVSWFGLETPDHAPHGLGVRSMGALLDQIVSLGFNSLRVPFSTELLDPGSAPNGIDYARNPELKGLDGFGVLDALVRGATARGLAVVLDRHRIQSGSQSALWYDDKYDEARWIDDFRTLSTLYRNEPLVVGFDLHNDAHDPATWGDGNQQTDFRAAAERAGNAILESNPNVLVIVEGIETVDGTKYWWGGNLAAAGRAPVTLNVPNKVVYATSDYPASVSDQSWFHDASYPANLPALWDATWGYLPEKNLAPVYIAGFGTRFATSSDQAWLSELHGYVHEHGTSFAYWCLNPDSTDTGGILQDDWTTPRQDVLDLLDR
jgi:endoglucanase